MNGNVGADPDGVANETRATVEAAAVAVSATGLVTEAVALVVTAPDGAREAPRPTMAVAAAFAAADGVMACGTAATAPLIATT